MSSPKSAAVFDLDGTLLPGTSAEREFVRWALASGELPASRFARRLASWLARVPSRGIRRNKTHFGGIRRKDLEQFGRRFVGEWLMPRIPGEAQDAIERHRQRGDVVGIVSGAPQDLIADLREALTLDFLIGTDLEDVDGVLTGRVRDRHLSGRTKVDRASALGRLLGFDLARSAAYGNAYSDRHLLATVANPFAVNPDGRLRKVARARGWPVVEI